MMYCDSNIVFVHNHTTRPRLLRIYVYTIVHTIIYKYAIIHSYMHNYACMYIYIYVYIYIHTHAIINKYNYDSCYKAAAA